MEYHRRIVSMPVQDVVVHGFKQRDPENLTRQEVLNEQLDAIAPHMIQKGLL